MCVDGELCQHVSVMYTYFYGAWVGCWGWEARHSCPGSWRESLNPSWSCKHNTAAVTSATQPPLNTGWS